MLFDKFFTHYAPIKRPMQTEIKETRTASQISHAVPPSDPLPEIPELNQKPLHVYDYDIRDRPTLPPRRYLELHEFREHELSDAEYYFMDKVNNYYSRADRDCAS